MPKDLPAGYGKDRIVVMVRDPYWLHGYWELTRQAIQRAEAALGQDWHGAQPILRLLDVSSHDTTSHFRNAVRDIDIHGGCNNWYIDVANPPRSFRVDIGYLSRRGQFYVLARSNVVSTPRAGMSDVIDENWADIDADEGRPHLRHVRPASTRPPAAWKCKQLFEERLRRPLGSPTVTSFGSGASCPAKVKQVLVPARRRADRLRQHRAERPRHASGRAGQAAARRHVHHAIQPARQPADHPRRRLPGDGIEERTIVLAVERNTEALEPMIHDMNEGE